MATAAQLERLGAILERLDTLGSKDRGELIRAADWNALVGTVNELARSILGEDRIDAIPPHGHDEQVELGWLSPSLRQLITKGPLAEPKQVGRVTKLERDVASLRTERQSFAADVQLVRQDLNEVTTRDLIRESTVNRLDRQVLGIGDTSGDLTELRTSLAAVQDDVQRAIVVGQQLDNLGEPLDVQALLGRIDSLETIGERLTLPNGDFLDATAFTVQLSELETRLVTEDDLTQAFENFGGRGGIDPSVRNEIAVLAGNQAAGQLEVRLGVLASDLRTELATGFAGIDVAAVAAVDAATPEITAAAVTRAEAVTRELVAEREAELRADLTVDSQGRVDALGATLGSQLVDLETTLASELRDDVELLVGEQLTQVTDRLGAVEGRANETAELASRADVRSRDVATRAEQIARDATAGRAAVQTRLEAAIAARAATLEDQIGGLTAELSASVNANLRLELNALSRTIETNLARTAATAARTEVRLLRGQLGSNVREVVDSQTRVTRDELLGVVNERSTVTDARLRGLVADEVRRATGNLGALVDSAVEDRLIRRPQ